MNTTGNKEPFLHHDNRDPPLENLPGRGVYYVYFLLHANLQVCEVRTLEALVIVDYFFEKRLLYYISKGVRFIIIRWTF